MYLCNSFFLLKGALSLFRDSYLASNMRWRMLLQSNSACVLCQYIVKLSRNVSDGGALCNKKKISNGLSNIFVPNNSSTLQQEKHINFHSFLVNNNFPASLPHLFGHILHCNNIAMIIKNVWTIYNISRRENNDYNLILKPTFIYKISWRWWMSLTQSCLSVYLFQCDSVLLPWIPFKSEGVFPPNNKNPGIFEGVIYWASSNDYWAEYLTVRGKRFIYPWHRWCCTGPHSQPDWYLVCAVKYTKVGSCGLVLSHAHNRFSEQAHAQKSNTILN